MLKPQTKGSPHFCGHQPQKGNDNALEVDTPFHGEINHSSTDYWRAEIGVNGHPVVVKLDTGADVSVISAKEPCLKFQKFSKPKEALRGPEGSNLSVVGAFVACLTSYGNEVNEKVYFFKNQPQSLLSRNVCVKLGLEV